VIFVNDHGNVFDELRFETPMLAVCALKRNGFFRLSEDPGGIKILSAPEGTFHWGPPVYEGTGVYSSGEYWKKAPETRLTLIGAEGPSV